MVVIHLLLLEPREELSETLHPLGPAEDAVQDLLTAGDRPCLSHTARVLLVAGL